MSVRAYIGQALQLYTGHNLRTASSVQCILRTALQSVCWQKHATADKHANNIMLSSECESLNHAAQETVAICSCLEFTSTASDMYKCL